MTQSKNNHNEHDRAGMPGRHRPDPTSRKQVSVRWSWNKHINTCKYWVHKYL